MFQSIDNYCGTNIKKLDSSYGGISLTNADGSIINGYQPSIIRPLNNTDYSPVGDCKSPCYTNSKRQEWCGERGERDAINYYAMRPLITSNDYNSLLLKLFDNIITNNQNLITELDTCILEPKLYCGEQVLDVDELKEPIMHWLMERIALGVSKMPEFQKNSSWGVEQFHHTDVQLFVLDAVKNNRPTGIVVYKLIFNLYNPLRFSWPRMFYELHLHHRRSVHPVHDKRSKKEWYLKTSPVHHGPV